MHLFFGYGDKRSLEIQTSKMKLFRDMLTSVMYTSVALFVICLYNVDSRKVKRSKYGPSGLSFDDTTNCTEFSKFGRFNPYSVLYEKWFVFYYWAPLRPLTTYLFAIPSANHTKQLKRLLDGNCILPVMWSARLLLMEENNELLSLLVERGDRGEYWLYPVVKIKEGQRKITPRDIRLKQTGDNRLLGLMDCELQTTLVMARLNDVPPKKHLQDEAARLGFRGRRGKSYLYQGHEWGPIPEADEELVWDYRSGKKRAKESSKDDPDRSEEKVELQPVNIPEDSQEEQENAEDSKAIVQSFDDDDQSKSCIRLDPELWNDPKPSPLNDPDKQQLSKRELDRLTDAGLNNTRTVETPDRSQNNKLEKNLENKTQITQENNKDDRNQEIPLRESKNLDLHTEETEVTNTQTNEGNCAVCFKSTVSVIVSTNDAYRPENSRSIQNFEKNENARAETPRVDNKDGEMSRPKIYSETPVPLKDLNNSSAVIILAPQTLDDIKS